MTSRTFVRARRPEQKQQRRADILAAARELALRDGVRNVTLGGVAAAVGLAKSNVVRYFGTREEIYLVLALEECRGFADEVTARLRAGGGRSELVDAFVETLMARPLLCDLLGHTTTSLEHNVSLEAAREYKTGFVDLVAELGRVVAELNPGMTERDGIELVGGTILVAGSVYQSERPPPTLAALYAQDPELAARCALPFEPTMRRLVTILAAGIAATRDE
ncbi:TetR family transcriptional regulator [Thermopolyspora sp. NPDC052614]|uniref:TetR/AcrR family transcriptional regulator n=1 Tax=Thermopolyspora sp. NPDC052614 TaxID=3155682 RepID=UPI00343F5534